MWRDALKQALGPGYIVELSPSSLLIVWHTIDRYTKELRFRVALSPGPDRKLHVQAERNRVMVTVDNVVEAATHIKFMTTMEGW